MEELRNIFVSAPQETDFLSYNKYKMNFFLRTKISNSFWGHWRTGPRRVIGRGSDRHLIQI